MDPLILAEFNTALKESGYSGYPDIPILNSNMEFDGRWSPMPYVYTASGKNTIPGRVYKYYLGWKAPTKTRTNNINATNDNVRVAYEQIRQNKVSDRYKAGDRYIIS